MTFDLGTLLLNAGTSTAFIAAVGIVMRGTIADFFSKSIEHRFEKKLETFKAGIRINETELDQIRSFLVSTRRERDSAIQTKRLEAAETLLRARHTISQLSILVEYMKVLNTEEILNDGANPKITTFIESLIKPFDIDEKIKILGKIDQTIPRLYLSDKPLKLFDAYQSIITHAAFMMKIFSIPQRNKNEIIKTGSLSKIITEIVPSSKEGFDKWGEGYAYHWSAYFYDQILHSLRHEVSGADDLTRDTESIERVALDSHRAQNNIRASLAQADLPDTLLKPDKSTSASSSFVKKAIESLKRS